MSRSGYSDDLEVLALGRWRGQVASAIRGKRGQAFLREMLQALDAMPEKRLVRNELEKDGEVCALGAVGKQRGIAHADIDPEDSHTVARRFGIARQLACEIEFENDDDFAFGENEETPGHRWTRMRAWVVSNLTAAPDEAQAK